MNLKGLTDYLDGYFQLHTFSDTALNGLQVENSGAVSKIALAVDAGLEAITAATREECNLLVVHHGLFWGRAFALRSYIYQRIKALILADMALYAVHLPLDAHPEVGHNSQIAKQLMLADLTPFGIYAGSAIGVQGNLTKTLSRDAALTLCEEKIGPAKTILPYGPEKISRIGIISGSASEPEILEEAAMNGIDLLITGEPKQPAYYLAREIGLNLFFGGHYQTETFGLKALQGHLTEQFDMPAKFIETACPL